MTLVDDRVAVDGEEIRVLFREARRRRRRRWIIGALVLTVALITFAVLTLGRSRSANTPAAHKTGAVAGPAVSAMPAEVVALGNDFGLEVLSSRDGHVIRTLARNVGTFHSEILLSVSPAGTVYFGNRASVHPEPVDAIYSVPVTGGPVRHVADGHSPAVSPNGRFLAYVGNHQQFWSGPPMIVVEDVRSHAIRSWTDNQGSDPASLSWSTDSRFLSFTEVGWTRDPPNQPVDATYWVLDTTTRGQQLGPARRLTLAAGVAWSGFMPESPNGTLLGIGAIFRHKAVSLIAVDARSGRIVRSLVTIPGTLFGGDALAGPGGDIQADPSGQHFLIAATEPKGYGSELLYRWSSGTAGPIAIGKDGFAAWIPASIH